MFSACFVTGATGLVSSAVVAELIGAGHQVLGLARSGQTAAALPAVGAKAHRGGLDDLEAVRSGAADADAVIHMAFNHDFSKFAENCEQDRRAIEAMGETLIGSDRLLIVTSGVALLAKGRMATEDDRPATDPHAFPRRSEAAAMALAARGVRTCIVRLAPSVHGEGDHGFVPILIGIAREKGVSAYVGDGSNRWPGVHRLDAARLYRLVLEHGESGSAYHAVAEEGVPFKQIAEVIGRRLAVPLVGKSSEEAAKDFGRFTMFASADMSAASNQTRAKLGWRPEQPSLLADIDQPYYFIG